MVKPLSSVPAELLPANAPRASLTSINAVYDKRAAAYKKHMAALTALPPTFPSSLSSAGGRNPRARTASNDSWLTPGQPTRRATSLLHPETDAHSAVAGPRSVRSSDSIHARSKPRLGPLEGSSLRQSATRASSIVEGASLTPVNSALRKTSAPSRTTSRATVPAPIADVVSTRYAGMSPPPHAPVPPRLDPTSPYISIFSNRYGGSPHDGDDSDDNEQPQQNLTVVENDWRTRMSVPEEGFERKGRWGQLKGAMGRKGRK